MRRLFGPGAVIFVALSLAAAYGAETNQDSCYQEALARQPERAATLDWATSPAPEKLSILEAGLKATPDCAYLHYLRGLVLDSGMNRPKEALKAFERAVEIIPTFDLAHENIAIVHRSGAERSFAKPALKPETKEDLFRLTRAVAALKKATEVVSANLLWGKERTEHLERVTKAVERELAELKAQGDNADFLAGKLTEVEVKSWRANVRAGFGLAHPVVATMKRGAKLKVSPHSRYGWVKVRLDDGKHAWVFHNLIE